MTTKSSYNFCLDISIVTFNSERWIESYFSSLAGQDFPINQIRVLVVDNGSSDNTVEEITRVTKTLEFKSIEIEISDNLGFGHGHNINIKKSNSEFILISNIDLEFESDTIVSALSFAVKDSNKVASWEFRQKPYEHPKVYDPRTLETTWSSSACTLFRRDALQSVNGYDEAFFMYAEDVDLSWRLRSAGYILRYLPSSVCWHHTYEEGTFKKIQFLGSLLGNLYLKARFGNPDDLALAERRYLDLMNTSEPNYKLQRDDMSRDYEIYRSKHGYFNNPNNPKEYKKVGKFVDEWDYEITRTGALYLSSKMTVTDESPLVTVIVRTYGGRGLLLKQCLKSVINQTYPKFEVIVVQDGGEDLRYVADEIGDPRIKFIGMPKVGRCLTGNRGLTEASGTYINFLDDDDLFYADHLETCVGEALRNPDSLAFYTDSFECKSKLIKDSDGTVVDLLEDSNLIRFSKEYYLPRLLDVNLFPIQAVFFHRSLVDLCGLLNPVLDNLEDWDLWVRYSTQTSFFHIKKTTSLFRTPLVKDESADRVKILNSYYDQAIALQSNLLFKNLTAYELRRSMSGFRQEIRRLEVEISSLIKDRREQEVSFQVAQSEIRSFADQVEALRLVIKNRDDFIDSIRRSSSWRLTYPLRAIKRILQRWMR